MMKPVQNLPDASSMIFLIKVIAALGCNNNSKVAVTTPQYYSDIFQFMLHISTDNKMLIIQG